MATQGCRLAPPNQGQPMLSCLEPHGGSGAPGLSASLQASWGEAAGPAGASGDPQGGEAPFSATAGETEAKDREARFR